jgi:hypothetical protein
MTTKQRMSILVDRWPAACRAQGWNKSDRELRLSVISSAVGRPVNSLNDLDNSRDIDAVYAALGRLTDNVGRTVEVDNDEPGYRRRILWLVRKHGHELGGEPYILALARDRFHLTAGLRTIEDLSTEQLDQLMITLNARRQAKARNERKEELQRVVAELELADAAEVMEESNCPF